MTKLTKKIMLLLVAVVLIVVVSVVIVVNSGNKDKKTGIGEYTYNSASSVFPTNWNPFTYQTSTASDIIDYCVSGFYEFDYNDNETGYQIVNAMASEKPIDVTSNYIGQYGVKDGDKAKVYKIKLRNDLKWDDGTVINPQSFVNSAKLLLDPVAQNYRADSLYSGNLEIYNAKNYLYQGQYKYTEAFAYEGESGDYEGYVMMEDLVVDDDGVYHLPEGHEMAGEKIAIDLSKGGQWSSSSLNKYADYGYFILKDENGDALKDKDGNYVQLEAWTKLKDAAVDNVVVMTTETVKYIQDVIAWLHDYDSAADYAAPDGTYEELFPKYLISYTSMFMGDSYKEQFVAKWNSLPETTTGEGDDKVEGKDAFASVEYKVLVVTGEGKDAKYSWTDKTGVTTADEYALYKAYVNGEFYADYYAKANSQYNDYAYYEWEEMAFVGQYFDELDFSEVGVFLDNDGDLCLALTKQLDGFYLLYSLTGTWLVHEEKYAANASIKDGVYSNKYGTSVKTFASYGPYKLSKFQQDKQYVLVKNDNWYGYNDEENKQWYQTTKIKVTYIKETSTKLEAFIKGQLDVYGLTADDMADYSDSESRYDSRGASTFFVAFNPDKGNLEASQAENPGTNKTILTNVEFRKALSLSLDRVAFCLACDPTGIPATAVFNSLIISDPDAGTPYRNSEEAKDIILAFWGLTDQVGEGKRYATKDEAIAKITGVDLSQAKTLFDKAYEEALKDGLLKETDVIELTIGLPSTNTFYVKGYDFLENCWTEAVKGTKLEGKLRFTKDDTIGDSFADRLRDNSVDILFGVGWTGAALNPYGLINAYTLPSYQYDPAIDYTTIDKDVHFEEVVDANGDTHKDITLRASVADWSNNALQGVTITTYVVDENGETTKDKVLINASTTMPMSNRVRILWACEAAILEQYTLLPLDDQSSAVLKGYQIEYHTDEYIFGMGYGGVKYMTYTCDDYDWNQYVKEQGGKLNYK